VNLLKFVKNVKGVFVTSKRKEKRRYLNDIEDHPPLEGEEGDDYNHTKNPLPLIPSPKRENKLLF